MSLKILLKLVILLDLSPQDYMPPQLLKSGMPPCDGNDRLMPVLRAQQNTERKKRKTKNGEISGQMTISDFMEENL